MSETLIYLKDLKITATNLKKETLTGDRKLVSFDFKVTSENYHDVTTILYENKFNVNIPEHGLEFAATINNYSTSITNLYEKDAVGDYYLELIETELKGIS